MKTATLLHIGSCHQPQTNLSHVSTGEVFASSFPIFPIAEENYTFYAPQKRGER